MNIKMILKWRISIILLIKMKVLYVFNKAFHRIIKEKCELDDWSIDQKKKLIEAIEKHGENWDEILKV